MSELNNKKTNKLLKFTIIYTILIIIVTVVLIFLNYKYSIDISEYFTNSNIQQNEIDKDIYLEGNNNKNQVKNEEVDYSKIERTTVLDKYHINNIELKTNKLTYGNIVDYSYDGNPIYKVNVEYIEISGLKNKEIQNKINNGIKEKAESLVLDEEIYDKSVYSINIVAGTIGDYSTADLLSMPVTKEIAYKENTGHDEDRYVTLYCPSINYRLDNGEEIKLEDLFTKDASIKNILAQTAYDSLAFEYGFNEEFGDGDLDEVDYGKIENDLYNVITSFKNQKENVFWFNQEYISIVVNNKWYSIKNSDFIDYININNIVKVKNSIYENGDNPKINYVFSTPYISSLEYFDQVSNNMYLSIFNWYRYCGELVENGPGEEGTYKEYTDKLVNSVDELIDAMKNDTKKERGKGYIYNIYNYQEEYYNENQENIGPAFLGEKVEVDLDNFMENVETAYALNSKKQTGGEYVFSFSNLIYSSDYKVWDIIIRDTDNDGELQVGQKLYNKEDWEEFFLKEYEY